MGKIGVAGLYCDAFHVVKVDLVVTPIVESGCSRAFVSGHGLSNVDLAAIFDVLRNSGGAEGVISDPRPDAGRASS
jgi:hypothetical protein